ncbi:phage portal protein [Kineococcus terrestris]|uniref:phage portal protein n=1 Tax=Kineococcus terrestris TaxID=2044856 RepID=UPI0034DACBFB
MRPTRPGSEASSIHVAPDASPLVRKLAQKSETNFLPLVLDTFSQVLKVDGIYSSTARTDRSGAWEHWQRNGMDARQTGVHRTALQYGVSYLTVLPGDTGPVMRGRSPRSMTALYQDPADDDWPMQALDVDRSLLKLYDETHVYFIGHENKPASGLASLSPQLPSYRDLHYIEARRHDVGVTPIVRFRDRMLLDGEEQYGLVEPLLKIQERINQTTFEMLVAQYFAAFRQRYVIGWVPKSEQERLKASASTMWTFDKDPDKMKLGEFEVTPLTPYIESKKSGLYDLAAIAQVPAQNLGVDALSNISAEALAALEAGKDRKADEISTSFGESWELALRTCAALAGDRVTAEDFGSEVRWKDATARSFAQTVDGLGKLATMLDVPKTLLWEDVPGWSSTRVERARQLRAREQTDLLAAMGSDLGYAPPG